jgi:hypothetical protein
MDLGILEERERDDVAQLASVCWVDTELIDLRNITIPSLASSLLIYPCLKAAGKEQPPYVSQRMVIKLATVALSSSLSIHDRY